MMRSWIDAAWRLGLRLIYPLARLWWRLTSPTIHGAHVILRVRGSSYGEDEILLVRNSYKTGVSAPCGGIKRGERPVDGALRELHEEVGISIPSESLRSAGEIFLIHEGRRDHGHFFECVVPNAQRPQIRLDNREVIWAEFIPQSKALGLDLVPHLRSYLERDSGESAGCRTMRPRDTTPSGSAN